MKIYLSILSVVSVLFLNSCGYMFAEVIGPSQCKKCQIISDFGNVVDQEDGCGGSTYNMEQRIKAKAFDYGCGYTVVCQTYREPATESKSPE